METDKKRGAGMLVERMVETGQYQETSKVFLDRAAALISAGRDTAETQLNAGPSLE